MIKILINISIIIIVYIAGAIFSDVYINMVHPDALKETKEAHEGTATEIQIVLFWPVFWAGYIYYLITKR